MKGTLKNGFKYEVNDEILNDWEFVKLYRKTQSDSFAAVDLVIKLLGEEQEEKLSNYIRNKNGIVPTDDIAEAISEIMEAIQDSGSAGKNL